MSNTKAFLVVGFWIIPAILIYLMVKDITEDNKQMTFPHKGNIAEVLSVGGCKNSGYCGVTLKVYETTSCTTNRRSKSMVTSAQVKYLPYVGEKVCFVKEVSQ